MSLESFLTHGFDRYGQTQKKIVCAQETDVLQDFFLDPEATFTKQSDTSSWRIMIALISSLDSKMICLI